MRIKVKYFGIIAEKVGENSEEIDIEFSKKLNLKHYFEEKHPKIKNLSYRIAINQEFCDFLEKTDSKIEVAILPPFAGG